MHLSSILFGYRVKFLPRKLPKGNIWRGKYRLVRKVTMKDLVTLKDSLDREEKNMFYLRNPYLTKEEYEGVDHDYFKKFLRMMQENDEKRFKKFKKTEEDRKVDVYLRRVFMPNDAWE